MPQIIVRGVEEKVLRSIKEEILDGLVRITSTNRTSFRIDLSLNISITEGYPFIDIHWFKRSLAMQDEVVVFLTEILKREGYPKVGLHVHEICRRDYYSNAEHYDEK